MIRYLALMLVVATAAGGCKLLGTDGNNVNCTLPDGSSGSGLYGCWDMISTSGGFAGGTHKPHEEGYTVWLELQPGHQFLTFRDGEAVRGGTFTITKVDGQQELSLTDSSGHAYPFKKLVSLKGADTLVLADYCCDGYISTYVRMK